MANKSLLQKEEEHGVEYASIITRMRSKRGFFDTLTRVIMRLRSSRDNIIDRAMTLFESSAELL